MRQLVTICLLLTAATTVAQERLVSMVDVLEDIESHYNVRFAYDYQLVANTKVASPDLNLDLDQVLDRIFVDSRLTFQKGSRVIIVKPRPRVNRIAKRQEKINLSGFIKDGSTGEPLPKATLHILNTRRYSTTNFHGFFMLKDIPHDTSSIEVKFIGYESVIIKARDFDRKLARINLAPRPSMLDPIIVNDQLETFSFQPEASAITMNPESSRMYTTLGQPDIIRSIQLLPGVSGSNESSDGLSIRGGSPDQNLVLFDGFTVYNLGHFFGTLSAFNSKVINDVSLHKGGFGAEYGGRVSSVIDIESKNVAFDSKTRGSVGVDLMSVNALVETAVSDKVSVLVAGRRSYTDFIKTNVFNNISNNLTNDRPGEISNFGRESFIKTVNPEFGYYDVNAKVDVNLKEGRKLGFSFYNSGDNLSVIDNDILDSDATDIYYEQKFNEKTSWGNTGVSLNYQHQWSPLLNSKMTFAHSSSYRNHELDYFLDFHGEGLSYYQDLNLKDKNVTGETSVRVDNHYQINRSSLLQFGAFNINSHIEYHNSFDLNIRGESLSENVNQSGVYIQGTYRPVPKVALTGGLRGTYYTGTDLTYLEPRIAINFKPIPTVNLKGAVGRYYQFVSEVTSNNPFATQKSFWVGIRRSQRSNHWF